jgi:hypothetical protein
MSIRHCANRLVARIERSEIGDRHVPRPREGLWSNDGSAASVIEGAATRKGCRAPVKAEIAITVDFRRLCCAARTQSRLHRYLSIG